MTWLIILAILILLGFVQIGILADYNSDGAGLWLCIGPFRFRLYPGRKSDKKDKQKRNSNGKTDATRKSNGDAQKGSLQDFLAVAQFVFEVLSDFRRKIRIKNLQLKLILAGDDPCDLSVNYGRAWAALGALMLQLDRVFIIRNRNVEVECDYLADSTQVRAQVHITITIARLLSMIVFHGVRGLRKYYKIMKQIKGGATT